MFGMITDDRVRGWLFARALDSAKPTKYLFKSTDPTSGYKDPSRELEGDENADLANALVSDRHVFGQW